VPFSSLRLAATAVTAALTIASVGFGWETARFGFDRSSPSRIEEGVRDEFSARARALDTLAEAVTHQSALIVNAAGPNRDGLPTLFSTLGDLSAQLGGGTMSATLYSATGARGPHDILAWSDGPAEDPPTDRLEGPSSLFFQPYALGLLLVSVRPVEAEGRRIATAVAETVFAPLAPAGGPASYQMATTFGPVTLIPRFSNEDRANEPGAFTLVHDGTALADVQFSPKAVDASRSHFRDEWVAVTALPLAAALLVGAGRVVARRQSTSSIAFFCWSILGAAMVAACTTGAVALERVLTIARSGEDATIGLGAAAIVVIVPVSWWWRRLERRHAARTPARFVLEQAAAGVGLAALVVALAHTIGGKVDAAHLNAWQFPIFPIDTDGLLYLSGLLLLQISVYGAAVSLLATMAARWRLDWRHPGRALAAAGLWLVPLGTAATVPSPLQPLPSWTLLPAGIAAAAFALAATTFRRYYRRRATQGMRLVLMFGALLAPAIVFYPTAWWYEDRAAESLVERQYGPATQGQTDTLVAELDRARADIDKLPAGALASFAGTPPAAGPIIPSRAAFQIWTETGLAAARITSGVELYGADRRLVSRFALNIPEYANRAIARTWQGSSCTWQVFHEVDRFGGEDRPMLHAERGLCSPDGSLSGAVVVHIARDYRSLPFLSSANPYAELLGAPGARAQESRLMGLQLVVYGWAFHPSFASGQAAWPIDVDTAHRLEASRATFWETLPTGDQMAPGPTYRVYFSNDRGGIYAIGYPTPTPFQHLTRLASAATLTGGIFLLFVLASTVRAPFARRHAAPLTAVFDEIRTSFHRKLFLFFVFAAVGPVLLMSLAFGAYMAKKFRDDVQGESRALVTVAQRVLAEFIALQTSSAPPGESLTDDVMVWTGRVLEQDVNLFQGARLEATSQRDLFDSGLLPMRTPAAVYRAIALERLPTAVEQDRLGDVPYLVAAAPLASSNRNTVLCLPLALRQREIERQIDELSRGMLVGGVFVILVAAALGASIAGRISDPVARLTRATRQIAKGDLDVRIVADTADELRRLVDDFNSMAATLGAQRAELVRSHQFKAWAEMARQVAHEIKNPLTPIQLAAEHLQRVHEDQQRPLGQVFDLCLSTILRQVRLLRQIAGEFANFAGEPRPHLTDISPRDLVVDVLAPYRAGLGPEVTIDLALPNDLPAVHVDRTLVGRAFTNIFENALQAMPQGGSVRVTGSARDDAVEIDVADTGVGMDAAAARRAFEPYFSTKTAGSGLGLVNAKRNVELCGGTMTLASVAGQGTTVTITLPRGKNPVEGFRGAPASA
jgi:signal transduction histidine kinase